MAAEGVELAGEGVHSKEFGILDQRGANASSGDEER